VKVVSSESSRSRTKFAGLAFLFVNFPQSGYDRLRVHVVRIVLISQPLTHKKEKSSHSSPPKNAAADSIYLGFLNDSAELAKLGIDCQSYLFNLLLSEDSQKHQQPSTSSELSILDTVARLLHQDWDANRYKQACLNYHWLLV